jgi:hypothetical protein
LGPGDYTAAITMAGHREKIMTTARGGSWQFELYIALAIVGLVGSWAQVGGYLSQGFLAGNIAFWKDTVTTPASTFLTVDIFVLAAALFTWMFGEGRRLDIGAGWLWAYFLGSVFIAISFAFPLFMAHRQKAIRAKFPEQDVGPGGSGIGAVLFAVASALGAAAYSLTHMPG